MWHFWDIWDIFMKYEIFIRDVNYISVYEIMCWNGIYRENDSIRRYMIHLFTRCTNSHDLFSDRRHIITSHTANPVFS